MQALRWGIVGCGNISTDFVTSLRLAERNHQVVAAASRNLENAREFTEKFKSNNIKPYGNYSDLFADSNVDIVYIGVQNIAHAQLTIQALNSGKHVLCEKPMAVNAKEVREMVEAARKNKKFLMEAMWSRFFPVWREIRQKILDGELGTVKHFHFNIAGRNPRFNLANCETPTMSVGVYCVALSLYLFDEEMPIRINAIGEKNEHGFEEWCNLTLSFKNGRHSTLYYDWSAISPWNAYITGNKGQIQIPCFCWSPTEYHQVSNYTKYGDRNVEKFEFPFKDDESNYRLIHSEGLHFEADHVFDQIKEGRTESEVMGLETSIKVADILDEVRRQLGVRFPQDE